MQRTVFKVLTNDLNSRTGQRLFVNFETTAKSLEELYQQFQDDKMAYGQQLFTKPSGERDILEITDRREIILGREAVHKVEIPKFRFAEYED